MPWHCRICDIYYNQKSVLYQHMTRLHDKELHYACDICKKKFAWLGDLQQHIKACWSLYQEKLRLPLVPVNRNLAITQGNACLPTDVLCDTCGKMMPKGSFKAHLLTHSTEKTFVCQLCGLSSVRGNYLRYHQNRCHSDDRKEYKCDICDKAFTSLPGLKSHRLGVHTEERPWVCKICGKSFPRKISLTYHIRTHTEEQPYECTVCSRRFKKTEALKVHLRTHTKERPFSCDDCGKTFSHKVSLVKYHRCPNAKGTGGQSNKSGIRN